MKEIKKYQCEHCGTVYDYERGAYLCESNHKLNGTIDRFEHSGRCNNYDGYPSKVYIRFEDGKIIGYEKWK